MTTNASSRAVLTREAILALLTDDEIARVSVAEGADKLIEGDEYVDLIAPADGIQQVQAVGRTAPGHALSRSSVSDASWNKIVALVGR